MKVVGVILGGGAGTRLQPLTLERSKPAVPIAGKYRLVDIPISNCINNGIEQIYVLTQFNSESLHRHIQTTYNFGSFSSSFVRILAAEQTPNSGNSRYNGTADAVRKTLTHYKKSRPDLVVILSGDQLYSMDFRRMMREHIERKAEVTIATKPTDRRDAGALGIMQVDEEQRIINFVEKPGDTDALTALRAPMYDEELFLASMGIYIFNTDVLERLLDNDSTDFGKEIIPEAIGDTRVYSHIYEGYWRDIGTIRNFWESSLQLTEDMPGFSLYDSQNPIYTRMRYLPPSKVLNCKIKSALLSEGCVLSGAEVSHSLVGIRGVLGEGTVMRDTVMMGADYYEAEQSAESDVPLGVGKSCFIESAIIDKNVRIGDNVTITPVGKEDGAKTDYYTVSEGVIVIPKGTVIPSNTML